MLKKLPSNSKFQSSIDQANIAVCYQFGLGVKENKKKAIEWYCKAASSGNKFAVEQLSVLLDEIA